MRSSPPAPTPNFTRTSRFTVHSTTGNKARKSNPSFRFKSVQFVFKQSLKPFTVFISAVSLSAQKISPTPTSTPQRLSGKVIWLYGLSGAGKSTLGEALERQLRAENYVTQILDGDVLRRGLNRDLGFSEKDRIENIRRAAELAKLFSHAGVVTICSFITPLRAHRALAREIISAPDLIEVYIEASYATCAQRDPKGLYARAAAGQLASFTGRDSAFEPPIAGEASLVLSTESATPAASLATLHALVSRALTSR